ncbi:hypothetical protein [Romboutsia sp. 1001713B170131_170501_G6]|uniref:hypothetical protein n=1 Tax=Romboutsia sp. 1001713B170131_170501_G6 TaxID=2787108 RepID=UPI0018AAC84F|nr:hypothetical protein [Romboutsia sp. 1001713B170131_170501_G6]
MKIGQEIIEKQDYEIEKMISKDKIKIKVGDKGFVDSRGRVNYTTGAGRGAIVNYDLEVKGYDHENIAKMIFNRLNAVYGLETYLEDEEIEYKEFVEEIEDVLMDIL